MKNKIMIVGAAGLAVLSMSCATAQKVWDAVGEPLVRETTPPEVAEGILQGYETLAAGGGLAGLLTLGVGLWLKNKGSKNTVTRKRRNR